MHITTWLLTSLLFKHWKKEDALSWWTFHNIWDKFFFSEIVTLTNFLRPRILLTRPLFFSSLFWTHDLWRLRATIFVILFWSFEESTLLIRDLKEQYVLWRILDDVTLDSPFFQKASWHLFSELTQIDELSKRSSYVKTLSLNFTYSPERLYANCYQWLVVVVQIDIANHWSSPCDHDASSDHKYQTFYHCTWVSSEKLIFVSKSTTMIFIIPLTISTSAKRMMVIKRWESKTVGLISSHQLNVGKYSDGTQGENVLKDGNLSTTVEMNVKAM